MKGNMNMIKKLVLDSSLGRAETSTEVAIKTMKGTVTVKCSGPMGHVIMENG